MLEWLSSLDSSLFEFLNGQLANPITDVVMPLVTSDTLLRVLYGAALAILLWRGNTRLRWLALFSAFALLLTDQLAAQTLKPLFERPRPCHVPDHVHLLVGCGGGYAMPSAHAANAFGQALLFSLAVKPSRYYVLAAASLIALSRVFVGVHYPGDILVGAVIGGLAGWAVAVLFAWFEKKTIKQLEEPHVV